MLAHLKIGHKAEIIFGWIYAIEKREDRVQRGSCIDFANAKC